MSKPVEKVLFVSRDLKKNFFDVDSDIIDHIMIKHGFQQIGSGAGFGKRNLEFAVEGELSKEQLSEMKEDLAKTFRDRSIDVEVFD